MSEPISGVSIEQYARLCAAMADTGDDEAAQLAIAAEAGVDEASWTAAKDGFTARMQDPADMGKTATVFMPLYQAAQAEARGGGPPCTLEQYAEISASYSFERDAQDNKIPPEQIFARHGISTVQWHEFTGYWTPRVNDPADPVSAQFPQLIQAESDKIFGIYRDALGSAVDPDDEDARPSDRDAARAARANARRPIDENPDAASPGAGPVAASPAVSEPTPPASDAPQPVAPPPPQEEPAVASTPEPEPEPEPEPAPTSLQTADDPTKVANLSDEDKLLAALVHACIFLGVGAVGPAIVWLIYRSEEKSNFVAWHAKHAFISHAIVLVLTVLTCGFFAVLIPVVAALEGYLAYLAYEGKRTGYPLMGDYPG